MRNNLHLLSALAAALSIRPTNCQGTPFEPFETPANVCTLRPNISDSNFFGWDSIIVSSQFELNETLGDCTEINGNVVIANDYDGLFELLVFNFNGSIYQPVAPGTSNITSIFLPWANYIHSIELQNVPSLEVIYIPVVTQMLSLTLSSNSTTEVIAESLVVANIISVDVANLHVNFSQLAVVESKLYLEADFLPPSTVDFPSLVNVNSMSIIGNMSSLFLPNLGVASIDDVGLGGLEDIDLDLFENFGLYVLSLGMALVVDLPSLYNASGISLSGYIQDIKIPLLTTINGILSISTNFLTEFSLSTLQSVMAISIEGKIYSFSMPAIENVQTWVAITSSESMDCSIPKKQFALTNSSYVAGIPTDDEAHTFDCKSFHKKGLSAGVKVVIALAAVVFFVALLGLTFVSAKRRKMAMNLQPALQISDHELDQRVSTPVKSFAVPIETERPPPYAESIASDLGVMAEPKSVV